MSLENAEAKAAGLACWDLKCSELGEETQRELQEMFGYLEVTREGNSKIQAVQTSGVGSHDGGKAEELQEPKRIIWPAMKLGVSSINIVFSSMPREQQREVPWS